MKIDTFLKKLLPHDENFYNLLEESAQNLIKAGVELRTLPLCKTQAQREDAAKRIKDIEKHLSYYLVIPSNDDICRLYGKIRNECRNQPIDDIDYWIAACARFYDIPLVTNNLKHFKGIEGLRLIK